MALNNKKGFEESKIHDKRIVDYYIKNNKQACLASDNEDKQKKFDIIINNHKQIQKYLALNFQKLIYIMNMKNIQKIV